MLLDPETLRPGARAPPRCSTRLDGDPRFKLELPAAQLEILTSAAGDASADAIAELRHGARRPRRGRRRAAARRRRRAPVRRAGGRAQPRRALRAHASREFGSIARRQLVFALQVHVAPGGADRALARLQRAALLPARDRGAGRQRARSTTARDTGLASVRPKIAELLPRQGVPPPLASWDELRRRAALGRARRDRAAMPNAWWWELRPHPRFGTLELRVPDAQTTVAEAAAIAALCQALVAWLGERFDARRAARRWPRAGGSPRTAGRRLRDGVDGEPRRPRDGRARARPASGCSELIDELEPVAAAPRLRGRARAGARAGRGQRRDPPAPGRRRAGHRGAAPLARRSLAREVSQRGE